LHAHLDGTRMTDREVGARSAFGNCSGMPATTGHGRHPLGGARAPTVWTVVAAEVDPAERASRARSTLHPRFRTRDGDGFRPLGQGSPGGPRLTNSGPRGIAAAGSIATCDEWLLAEDEPAIRGGETPAADPARAESLF